MAMMGPATMLLRIEPFLQQCWLVYVGQYIRITSMQIFHLLRIPLKVQPTFHMSDLADKRYDAMHYLFCLCYRVIQHSQSNYRKNQVQGRAIVAISVIITVITVLWKTFSKALVCVRHFVRLLDVFGIMLATKLVQNFPLYT